MHSTFELISPAAPHQIMRALPSLGHVLIHETPELYNTDSRAIHTNDDRQWWPGMDDQCDIRPKGEGTFAGG